MKAVKLYGIFLLVMAMMPGQVFSHALWKPGSITPPRSTDLTANLKVGPCGGSSVNALLPRSKKPKIFKPGESITVEWLETINHGGLFIIDYLDDTYTPLTPANEIQITDPFDDAASPSNPKLRSKLLTVPQVNCPKCSLRLIQEMWVKQFSKRPPEFDPITKARNRSNYFSCSDIRIESTNNVTPGKVTLPSQSRINNVDNVILNWVNPSELSNNLNNVTYRILILMDTKPIDVNPVNNTEYTTSPAGANAIGTAKVVYVGNLETTTISNLTNTDKLYFKIFTYNVSNLYSAGVSSNAVAVIPVAPIVSLEVKQGNTIGTNPIQDGTNILITANVTDDNINDTHIFVWNSNNFVDSDQVDSTFTIKGSDITNLPKDINYKITVDVTDSSGLKGSSSVDITLKANSPPPSSIGNDVITNVADNGGCSLSNSARFDPLLLLLTLLSLTVIIFRVSKEN